MKSRTWAIVLVMLIGCVGGMHSADAQSANDAAYTDQIRQDTTRPFFNTSLVDHLPTSSTVPTPRQFLGYIAGAPGHLTYSKDIDAYYRALAKASPRVGIQRRQE
jgi:hypothetical protein